MKGRFVLRLFLYLAIPLCIATLTGRFLSNYFLESIGPEQTGTVVVDVSGTNTFKEVCQRLENAGLLKHWRVLDIISKLKGKKIRIKAGEYAFSKSMTPLEIYNHLISGKEYLHKLIINPGMTVFDINNSLRLEGFGTKGEFFKLFKDKDLLVRAGLQQASFEGYFGPGVYELSKNVGLEKVIWLAVERADSVWTYEFQSRARELNMSRHEILTIASLIQKEAKNPYDFANFSAYIHQRLSSRENLQLESPIRYTMQGYSGKLGEQMMNSTSPYNTFKYPGLPPTPICIPSEQAIKAALNPSTKEIKGYKFVGNGDLRFY